MHDFILWYARDQSNLKFRRLYKDKSTLSDVGGQFGLVETDDFLVRASTTSDRIAPSAGGARSVKLFSHDNLTSDGFSANSSGSFDYQGKSFRPAGGDRNDRHWKTVPVGLTRMARAQRLLAIGNTLRQKRYLADFPVSPLTEHWDEPVAKLLSRAWLTLNSTPELIGLSVSMTSGRD